MWKTTGRAIDLVLHNGKAGEVYNVGAGNEWRNIDIIREILRLLGKPESLIQYVKDRPGTTAATPSTPPSCAMSWAGSPDRLCRGPQANGGLVPRAHRMDREHHERCIQRLLQRMYENR
jgi:hypothetical protein